MHFETVADCGAPPDAVWSVLVDLRAWPTWTDSMEEVEPLEGELREGARVRIDQPKLPKTVWTVTAVDPGRSFTWEARAAGVRSRATHTVSERADGSTIRLTLEQRGLLAPVLGRLTSRMTERYMDMEAAGLARRAEAGAGRTSDP